MINEKSEEQTEPCDFAEHHLSSETTASLFQSAKLRPTLIRRRGDLTNGEIGPDRLTALTGRMRSFPQAQSRPKYTRQGKITSP